VEGVGGEETFCPRAEAKPRRPALWARKPKQKNFLFLLEEKNRRAQNKKAEKIFLRDRPPSSAAGGGAERVDFFRNF